MPPRRCSMPPFRSMTKLYAMVMASTTLLPYVQFWKARAAEGGLTDAQQARDRAPSLRARSDFHKNLLRRLGEVAGATPDITSFPIRIHRSNRCHLLIPSAASRVDVG